jgi:hypothetical protein
VQIPPIMPKPDVWRSPAATARRRCCRWEPTSTATRALICDVLEHVRPSPRCTRRT